MLLDSDFEDEEAGIEYEDDVEDEEEEAEEEAVMYEEKHVS